MFYRNSSSRKLFAAGALISLMSPIVVWAQTDLSVQLRIQAQRLQDDLKTLKQFKEIAAIHGSPLFLSRLDEEIRSKTSALATLDKNIESTTEVKRDLANLKAIRLQLDGRVGVGLLSMLDQEIEAKQDLLDRPTGAAAGLTTSPTTSNANGGNPQLTAANTTPKPPAPAETDKSASPKVVAGTKSSPEANPAAPSPSPLKNANAAANVTDPSSASTDQFSTRVLGIVGADVTSTTSSGPQQQYFVEFDFRLPLSSGCRSVSTGHERETKCSGRHWEIWGSPRLASVPTSKTAQLSSLTSITGAASGLGQQTLSAVTQSFEFRGGLEYSLNTAHQARLFNLITTRGALVPGLILGGGFISPFTSYAGAQEFDLGSAGTANVAGLEQQFAGSPQLQREYPQFYNFLCPPSSGGSTGPARSCVSSLTPYTQIAFVLPDRSRFDRDYFAGLRFKVFLFNRFPQLTHAAGGQPQKQSCQDAKSGVGHTLDSSICPTQIFPGTFDLTLGQDESVTAGRLRGVVMSLGGNFPFPAIPWLRIFGTTHLRLAGNSTFPTLALPASQTFMPLNTSSIFIQPIMPSDQDYFRVGLGVDIDHAIRSLRGVKTSQ